jgi:hypothetical protein
MTWTLVRVQSVEPREGFTVDIHFTDGSHREINLEPYLHGPIFEPMRNDPSLFRSMRVDEGTITWPNGADIDPDVLYYGLTPAWAATANVTDCENQLYDR